MAMQPLVTVPRRHTGTPVYNLTVSGGLDTIRQRKTKCRRLSIVVDTNKFRDYIVTMVTSTGVHTENVYTKSRASAISLVRAYRRYNGYTRRDGPVKYYAKLATPEEDSFWDNV
jgi:hypothetical protein